MALEEPGQDDYLEGGAAPLQSAEDSHSEGQSWFLSTKMFSDGDQEILRSTSKAKIDNRKPPVCSSV